MADIVDIKGAPVAEFDALALEAQKQAAVVSNMFVCAMAVSEAYRARHFASAGVAAFDELAPLVAQMRARLAQPNPFAEARP